MALLDRSEPPVQTSPLFTLRVPPFTLLVHPPPPQFNSLGLVLEKVGASGVMVTPMVRQEAQERLEIGVVRATGEISELMDSVMDNFGNWIKSEAPPSLDEGGTCVTDVLARTLVSVSAVARKDVVEGVMDAMVGNILERIVQGLMMCEDVSVAGADVLVTFCERVEDVYGCVGMKELREVMVADLRGIERAFAEGGWRGIGKEVVAGIIRKSFEASEKRDGVIKMVLED